MNRARLLAFIICLAASCPQPARALLPDAIYTEGQKAGFAFYQLAHRTPDFKGWAAGTGEGDQAEILREGFRHYRPDQDMITVDAVVKVTTEQSEDSAQKIIDIAYSPDGMTYFPMSVGAMHIAIIPANENDFKRLQPDAASYKALSDLFGIGDGNPHDADIRIAFRPRSADAAKPMMIDKQPFWLMMADIGELEFWNKDRKTILWSQSAPWYQSGRSHELMDLKK